MKISGLLSPRKTSKPVEGCDYAILLKGFVKWEIKRRWVVSSIKSSHDAVIALALPSLRAPIHVVEHHETEGPGATIGLGPCRGEVLSHDVMLHLVFPRWPAVA